MAYSTKQQFDLQAGREPSEQGPAASRPTRGHRRGRAVAGWLLTRGAAGQLALIGIMVAVLWGSIWWHLAQQRHELEIRAARDSGNLAQAAAESLHQTIQGIDDALRFMRAIYASDPNNFDISVWTGRANRTREVALEFARLDRDGVLVGSSLGPVVSPVNFSEQAFFKTQTEDVLDQMYISQPILGRTSGRWSLLFTRKIIAADGWLMGMLMAAADPSWLTRLHNALDIGRGSLMLVGTDGRIRAFATGSSFDASGIIGMDLSTSPLLTAASSADQGTLHWASPAEDGMEQVVSFRRMADSSMIVAVGLDAKEIYAPYVASAQQYQIFGGFLTLLIVVTGAALLGNTRHLLRSKEVLNDAMEAISQGIIMVDPQGRVPVINRRATELLHIPELIAHDDQKLESLVKAQAATRGQQLALPGAPAPPAGPAPVSTYEHVQHDGTILEISTHPLENGGTVQTYTDITERKKAEAQIVHYAFHDSLTGLPNRRMFTERLAEAVRRATMGGERFAVHWVDLDRFKSINDLYGHAFGDRVIGQVADRLRALVRPEDTIARFDGDEFCILQASVDGPAVSEALGDRVVAALSGRYRIDGKSIFLNASVGIAHCPADGASVDQLLINADTAMYRAKRDGRATVRSYEPEMDVRVVRQRRLEEDLRNALALGQIHLNYQPICNSVTGKTAGFEALVRWHHPTQGMISPDDFIPVAEASGLILSLGQWVRETACAEAMRWAGSPRVAINLSPAQFREPDLPGQIAAILAKTGLPARRLTLEITEGVLIDNTERALAAISDLQAQGVQIALDDFGTGYASLSYLRRFPFNCIKIDKSFVRKLCDDTGSQAIVHAILTLGRDLNLNVVAEGVEDEAQLRWLRAEGCREVQGYLLGRPMPPDEIPEFLELTNHAAADVWVRR